MIARTKIEESRVQGVSLRPEGLLDALPEAPVRDLAEYLQGTTQVRPARRVV